MKLSLKPDLAPLRREVENAIEERFAAMMCDPMWQVHQLKWELAERGSAALKAEADSRGITLKAMTDQIKVARAKRETDLLALDARRLDFRSRLAAATQESEIRALRAEIDLFG